MHINRMVGVGAILGLTLLGGAVPVYAAATNASSAFSVAMSEPGSGASSDPSSNPSSDPSADPSPSPGPSDEPPEFVFDFDKVTLSPDTIKPGGTVTITVTCPTSVTAVSNAFVQNPKFSKTDDDTSTGTATYRTDLPDAVQLTVTCADFGSVTFEAKLGDGDGKLTPGGRTGHIPAGAPETGDGSTVPAGGGMLLVAGGSALALAAAGLGAGALRRRGSRQDQPE
jgi:hypothetical protein